MKLTLIHRIAFVVQLPVTCDTDDTASFEGIPPAVGAPASLFRLVLSVVCLINNNNIELFDLMSISMQQ